MTEILNLIKNQWHKEKGTYFQSPSKRLRNFLFIDDIKIFAKDENEIEILYLLL